MIPKQIRITLKNGWNECFPNPTGYLVDQHMVQIETRRGGVIQVRRFPLVSVIAITEEYLEEIHTHVDILGKTIREKRTNQQEH